MKKRAKLTSMLLISMSISLGSTSVIPLKSIINTVHAELNVTNNKTEKTIAGKKLNIEYSKYLEDYTITLEKSELEEVSINTETKIIEVKSPLTSLKSIEGMIISIIYLEGLGETDDLKLVGDEDIFSTQNKHKIVLSDKIETYTVTFNSNGGSDVGGIKEISSESKITSPTPPTKLGFTFEGWYKDSALESKWNFDTDKVTENTTLCAKWKKIEEPNPEPEVKKYTVNFNTNGGSGVSSLSDVISDSKIETPIQPTKSGFTFEGWHKDSTLENKWNFDTDKVTENTTLYAKWTKTQSPKPGGTDGSSSSSGGSSSSNNDSKSESSTITVPSTKESDDPTKAIATVQPTVKNETSSVIVTQSTILEAIRKAQTEAKKNKDEKDGISVEIKVDNKNNSVQNVSTNLPKLSVDALVKSEVKEFNIDMGIGKLNFDLETLKTIQSQIGLDVEVSSKRVDNNTLSEQSKQIVGNRPVFDFSITGVNGQKVTNFGKGKIYISIPYVLGENEKEQNLSVYYIDNEGRVQEVQNSFYDKESKSVKFMTDHFSKFAIGYKNDKVIDMTIFTDISTHWAKGDIEFVITRGLFSGTEKDKFSPSSKITRGMFATVLGRLADADVSNYNQSSFFDVKSGSYYMGYVEWSRKNNIVNGISEDKFAPDMTITREQMAVIISNYSKSMSISLPKVNNASIFADSEKINNYAKTAVAEMQMAGIILGKSNNKFDPQGNSTRAEVSAVIKRFLEIAENR